MILREYPFERKVESQRTFPSKFLETGLLLYKKSIFPLMFFSVASQSEQIPSNVKNADTHHRKTLKTDFVRMPL